MCQSNKSAVYAKIGRTQSEISRAKEVTLIILYQKF
jgi:hypothetical protein